MPNRTIPLLKHHEAFRSKIYLCSANKQTIGYGLNLEAGITKEEATMLLKMRVRKLVDILSDQHYWAGLSDVRRAVVIDMAYNLGVDGFFKFKRMIRAMSEQNYGAAAAEMMDSKWYDQVGTRSKRLVEMMRTNQWPEDIQYECC